MNAKLSLPRLSLRDYFASLFHEHPPVPAFTFSSSAFFHEAHLSSLPSRSFLDKGKARAIDAIDTLVDSMLYARTFATNAFVEVGASSASASLLDHSRQDPDPAPEDLLPAQRSASQLQRRRPDADPSPVARQRVRPQQQSFITPKPDGPRPPRHKKQPKLHPWDRLATTRINSKTIASRGLRPDLLAAGRKIIALLGSGSITEALHEFSKLYSLFDLEGHLDFLKAADGAAVDLNDLLTQPETADRLLLVRDMLGCIFEHLRAQHSRTLDFRWSAMRDERLAIEADIEDVFLWLFQHRPLLSFISFNHARVAFSTRLCIIALESPLVSARRLITAFLDRNERHAIPGLYQVFILALVSSDSESLAFQLFRDATERRVHVREVVSCKLARVLSVHRDFSSADRTFDMMEEQRKRHFGPYEMPQVGTLRTRVAHNARAGRKDLVTDDLNLLAKRPGQEEWLDLASTHLFAEVAMAKADFHKCDKILGQRFDLDWAFTSPRIPPAEGKRRPTAVVQSRRIAARVRAGRIHEAQELLQIVESRGVLPSTRGYEELLHTASRLGDVLLTREILGVHEAAGHEVTASVLVSVMLAFARRHDPESAQRVLNLMFTLDITVPRRAFNTLLLAQVNAGDWEGAFKQFNRLQHNKLPSRRPDLLAHQIVLKAMVLSGSSIREVLRFVELMRTQTTAFDSRTYALVMQCACDAGATGLAVEMFKAADKSLAKGADEFHYSILINGLLRSNQERQAKSYFDLMQKRGFQPSHVTYAMLVQQYARMGGDQNLQQANNVANWAFAELSQLQDEEGPSPADLSAMLFMPILRAEVDRGDSVAAEEIFASMSGVTGNAATRALTTLLDLYRRDGVIEAARTTWLELVTLASDQNHHLLIEDARRRVKKIAPGTERERFHRKRLRNPSSLCRPLSIVMDALSSAGQFDEALQAWFLVRDMRGHFDPDNWNVLMATHAQAGNFEDALAILEHVLCEDYPDWEAMRESARLGVFLPRTSPGRSAHLEDIMGPRGPPSTSSGSRRQENRVYEDAASTEDASVLEEFGVADEAIDTFEKEYTAVEDEEGNEHSEDEEGEEGDGLPSEAEERRSDDRGAQGASGLSRRPVKTESDPITVALRRRLAIDSCFWFAHEQKLAVLSDALERHYDGETSSGPQSDEDGTRSRRQRTSSSYPRMAYLRKRYPTAFRMINRFRRRRKDAAAQREAEDAQAPFISGDPSGPPI